MSLWSVVGFGALGAWVAALVTMTWMIKNAPSIEG